MINKRNILVVALMAVIGIIFVVILNYEGEETSKKDKNNNEPAYSSKKWRVDLSLDNKDPYGLYAFQQLAIAGGKFTAFNTYKDYSLLDSICQLDSSLMMFIGTDFTFTDKEIEKVLSSVENGNNFFLSVEKTPYFLYSKLTKDKSLTFTIQKKATHLINKKPFDLYYYHEKDTLAEIWDLFYEDQLPLSTKTWTSVANQPVYIEISYGKGTIFLHLNPLVFTNVQVLKKDGKNYLKEVLNTLHQPKIQWLSFAKYEPVEYNFDSSKNPNQQSLLDEIFKYPAFRWAFIMAVFGLLLYFVFRSKRHRPIIPAIQDNKNTGFGYVDTLAGIYFNKNSTSKMLKLMRNNFYNAVYQHFYIDLAKKQDNKALESLSKKSNVDINEIKSLLQQLKQKKNNTDNELIKTYQAQRSFYFKSTIWNEDVKEQQQEEFLIYKNKFQSIGVLIAGIIFLIFGFMMLTNSIGMGVLLWPISIVLLFTGTRMLNRPGLKIYPQRIEVIPIFTKKIILKFEEISYIEENGNFYIIHLKKGKKITINLGAYDATDLNQLENIKNRFNTY